MGSGWLGFHVAKDLINTGYRVKLSTRTPSRLAEITALQADPYLVDISKIDDSIQKFLNSDILIINIPSKSSADYTELLTHIEKSSVSRVLYISTTSVYPCANALVTENDTSDVVGAAMSPYLIIENLISGSEFFESTCIRFGGLIGYDRNPINFFKNKPIPDPESYVNLIHRDDCIGIIHQVIQQSAWGNTFNACADSHPTKREFYTAVTQRAGMTLPEFEETKIAPYKIVSNERVKAVLNYSFIYSDILNSVE